MHKTFFIGVLLIINGGVWSTSCGTSSSAVLFAVWSLTQAQEVADSSGEHQRTRTRHG